MEEADPSGAEEQEEGSQTDKCPSLGTGYINYIHPCKGLYAAVRKNELELKVLSRKGVPELMAKGQAADHWG